MATTSINERVETSHGAVERVNNYVAIEWIPEIQLPAEVGQDMLSKGRLTTDAATGKARVAFESRTYKGHPVQIGVDSSRPGLVELAEIARRMTDDAATAQKEIVRAHV